MKIATIILAAGSSHRFGETNKLLVEIGGKPLVRRAIDCALQSASTEIHVIIRPGDSELEAAVAGLPVKIGRNPHHNEGMGASISFAIAALTPDIGGAMILPADMPWMEAHLLDSLIERFALEGGASIVYPATQSGEQRNPVLWPKIEFDDLCRLHPKVGARGLLVTTRTPKIAVSTLNDAVFRDIDTPGDLPG